MTYERFEDVPVWKDAVQLAREVIGFTAQGAFAGQRGVREQLERAVLSVPNNIAEGFERGTTADVLKFLFYARGSVGEVRSMMYVLEGLKDFADYRSQITNYKNRCESISRQLYGWTRSLIHSDKKGQRHWNDKAKERKDGSV